MEVESDPANDATPIVIENGSKNTKAGFAGDETPRAVFPSIVGRTRAQGLMIGMGQMYWAAGDEAHSKRGILTLKFPIEHGIVTNWDNMEDIWHHTFYNVLRAAPEEHPVLLTEAPLNPRANREKTAQIMFETFDTPAIYLSISQVLSLYSVGRTTGLVVDSGHMSSQIVPIHRGQVVTPAVASLEIGGSHLTGYLMKLLSESGYSLCGGSETEVINDIKEELCYVSVAREESRTEVRRMYQLPDGQEIKLTSECFRCPEPIFQPSLIGLEESLPMIIDRTINKCDQDLRKYLSTNIVLVGGSTLFPGMSDRLCAELSLLFQGRIPIRVTAPPERRYSSWIGGSALASMDGFEKICLSKECYDEYGPQIVYRTFL